MKTEDKEIKSKGNMFLENTLVWLPFVLLNIGYFYVNNPYKSIGAHGLHKAILTPSVNTLDCMIMIWFIFYIIYLSIYYKRYFGFKIKSYLGLLVWYSILQSMYSGVFFFVYKFIVGLIILNNVDILALVITLFSIPVFCIITSGFSFRIAKEGFFKGIDSALGLFYKNFRKLLKLYIKSIPMYLLYLFTCGIAITFTYDKFKKSYLDIYNS